MAGTVIDHRFRFGDLRAVLPFSDAGDVLTHPPYHPCVDRRRFLLTSLAGAFAVPLAAEAQQAGRYGASAP